MGRSCAPQLSPEGMPGRAARRGGQSGHRRALAASPAVHDRTRTRLDAACGRFVISERPHDRVRRRGADAAVRRCSRMGHPHAAGGCQRRLGAGVPGRAFPARHGGRGRRSSPRLCGGDAAVAQDGRAADSPC